MCLCRGFYLALWLNHWSIAIDFGLSSSFLSPCLLFSCSGFGPGKCCAVCVLYSLYVPIYYQNLINHNNNLHYKNLSAVFFMNHRSFVSLRFALLYLHSIICIPPVCYIISTFRPLYHTGLLCYTRNLTHVPLYPFPRHNRKYKYIFIIIMMSLDMNESDMYKNNKS